MRRLTVLLKLAVLTATLAACGGPAPGTQPVNLKGVLERVAATVEQFDAYLRRYEYRLVDDAMLAQFAETIERDLNLAPRIHPTKITTKVRKDAAIIGYSDLNGNGQAEQKEPKLFTIEFDPDNNRIIATSAAFGEAAGHNMSARNGFFAGVFLGTLLDRQRQSGIQPGHFNKRNVAGAPPAAPKVAEAGAGPKARNRAGK